MMANEIPERLKERLKSIETETHSFSEKPEQPRRSFVLVAAAGFLIVAGLVNGYKTGDFVSQLGFFTFGAILFLEYLHLKQLHEMYSGACEIIAFYKKREQQKP